MSGGLASDSFITMCTTKALCKEKLWKKVTKLIWTYDLASNYDEFQGCFLSFKRTPDESDCSKFRNLALAGKR